MTLLGSTFLPKMKMSESEMPLEYQQTERKERKQRKRGVAIGGLVPK